mmetsp:Transcript_7364/g.16119  ORF Transcript_7364/g.16119 Transcript_7364/m.16119 type:complete len:236 (+) Transcript_7364:257-964(+)
MLPLQRCLGGLCWLRLLVFLLDEAYYHPHLLVLKVRVHLQRSALIHLLRCTFFQEQLVLGHRHGQNLTLQLFQRNRSCCNHFLNLHLGVGVEEHQTKCLIDRHRQNVSPLVAVCIHLYATHAVDPPQLSATVFAVVESLESRHTAYQLFTGRDICFIRLLWPGICLQDAYLMLNARWTSSMSISIVLFLQLIAQRHVHEHRRQLLDRLLATLNLQLGDNQVLSLCRDRELVEQPL